MIERGRGRWCKVNQINFNDCMMQDIVITSLFNFDINLRYLFHCIMIGAYSMMRIGGGSITPP